MHFTLECLLSHGLACCARDFLNKPAMQPTALLPDLLPTMQDLPLPASTGVCGCRLGASLAVKACAQALAREPDLASAHMLATLRAVVQAATLAEADPPGTGTRAGWRGHAGGVPNLGVGMQPMPLERGSTERPASPDLWWHRLQLACLREPQQADEALPGCHPDRTLPGGRIQEIPKSGHWCW